GGGYLARRAGFRFSKTLIDFWQESSATLHGWGSVLKNPDRLPLENRLDLAWLGFSSQKP
ncbi:hypothetical protein ACQX2M_09115, partial [Corynebacterium diphtheriae]